MPFSVRPVIIPALLPALLLAHLAAPAHAQTKANESSPQARATAQSQVTLIAKTAATLVVLNKSDDTVSLLDPESGESRATLGVGGAPHEVAVTSDGRLAYVANYGTRDAPGNSLSILDLRTGRVLSTIKLGQFRRPHGLTLTPDDRYLYVTVEGSQAVLEIDTGSERIARVFPTEQNVSHMCALLPAGQKLYVTNIGSRSVSIVDLESGGVSRLATGDGPEGIDVSPNGREVWVANRSGGDVVVIDTKTDTITARFPAGDFPIRVKFTPDGGRVLVSNARGNEIVVFDAATRAVEARIPTGEAPIGILIEPNGKTAWVAQTAADRISRIDLEKLELAGHVRAGREPDGLGWARPASGQAGKAAGR
jgi:YVTN family beta-propeller protein